MPTSSSTRNKNIIITTTIIVIFNYLAAFHFITAAIISLYYTFA